MIFRFFYSSTTKRQTNALPLIPISAKAKRDHLKAKNALTSLERLKPSIKVEETLRGQIAKFLRGNDSSEDYQIEFIDDCDEPAEQHPNLEQPAGAPAGKLVTVTGFNFPIADEDTVELLEATVNEDEVVRKEYVGFEVRCSTRFF